MNHTITVHHIEHEGSAPFIFGAVYTCGWSYGRNAPKWTLLAIQQHWVESGLTNDRGLLKEHAG
jgi:hypothetical protein